MKLIDEQKAELVELAARLMKPKEIAVIMGIDVDLFMKEIGLEGSEVYLSFHQGFLRTKSEINKSIVSHARAGSSPAQTLASRFITDLELEFDE